MAAKKRSIADVYVSVIPETARVASGIARAFKEVDPAAREAGRRWARDIDKELSDISVDVDVAADTSRARAEIDSLDGKTVHVGVDVDRDRLGSLLGDGTRDGARFGSQFGSAASDAAGTAFKGGGMGGPALAAGVVGLAGVAAQLSGTLGLLPATAVGAGAAIGSLALAFDGFGEAMSNIKDPQKFAEALTQLSPAAQSVATEIQGLMPIFDQLKFTVADGFFTPLQGELTKFIQTIGPMAQTGLSQLSSVFGQAAAGVLQQLQSPEMMATLQSMTDNIVSGFAQLTPAIQPFVSAMAQLGQVGSSFMPQLGAAITQAADGFAQFISQASESGKLQEWISTGITGMGQLFDLMQAMTPVFMSLAPIGQALMTALTPIFTALQPGIAALSGSIANLITAASPILTLLAQVASMVVTSLAPAFDQMLAVLGPMWATMAQQLMPIFKELAPVLSEVAMVIAQQLMQYWVAMTPLIEPMAQAFLGLVQAVTPFIPKIVELATTIGMQLLNAFVALVPVMIPVIEKLTELAQKAMPYVIAAVEEVQKIFEKVWPAVSGAVETAYNAMRPFMQSIVDQINWVLGGLQKLHDGVKDLPLIGGALSNLVPDLGQIPDLPTDLTITTLGPQSYISGGTFSTSTLPNPGTYPMPAAPPPSTYVAPPPADTSKPKTDWSTVPYTGANGVPATAAAVVTSGVKSASSTIASAAAKGAKEGAAQAIGQSSYAAANPGAVMSGSAAVLNFNRGIINQEQAWDCGPGSVQIVANGRGVIKSENALISEMGTTTSGTNFDNVVAGLNRTLSGANYRGVPVMGGAANPAKLYNDIAGSVKAGYGAVLNYALNGVRPQGIMGTQAPNYSEGTMHYVAVMGVDDARRALKIADPAFGGKEYWISADNAAAISRGRGYIYANNPANRSAPAVQAAAQSQAAPPPQQTSPAVQAAAQQANTPPAPAAAAYPRLDPSAPPQSFDVPKWSGPGSTSYSDLKRVRDAEQRVADAQFQMDQAGQRLTEMQYEDPSTIKPSERAAAENALAKARREHADAINDLTAAQQGYNEAAGKEPKKNKDGKGLGEDFGRDFVSGIAEAFGFDGSIFGNPADLGIVKLLGGLSKVKITDGTTNSGGDTGAGGGGGGLFGNLLASIPQAFGALNIGGPQDAAAPVVPGGPGSAGAPAIPGAQFNAQAQAGQTTNNYTVDNSMNLQGSQFGTSDLSSSVAPQQTAQGRTRVALRQVP
jgi:phage-related protein